MFSHILLQKKKSPIRFGCPEFYTGNWIQALRRYNMVDKWLEFYDCDGQDEKMYKNYPSKINNFFKNTVLSWNVRYILKEGYKKRIPNLVILLKSHKRGGLMGSIFEDYSGEIHGSIHDKVWAKYKECLKPGAALILEQVSVFNSKALLEYYLG